MQLLQHTDARYLCFAGFCFSLGFYCTNVGFQASSAAFVETIKASEPITSAVLAVAWGLEMVNRKEATSLAMIVCGVILSTLGNSPPSTTADDYGGTNADADAGLGMVASLLSCGIVMMSNLCFSFRGLFQKLFQKRSNQSILMDDLNLQYRMQQMGVLVFAVPAVLWEGRSVLEHIYRVSSHVGLMQSGVLIHYVGLASVNAVAFASYKYVFNVRDYVSSTFTISALTTDFLTIQLGFDVFAFSHLCCTTCCTKLHPSYLCHRCYQHYLCESYFHNGRTWDTHQLWWIHVIYSCQGTEAAGWQYQPFASRKVASIV